jgi:spore maturation protein CgeB
MFRSREELKEKVDYYLQRPEARRKIAEAGSARAHREHTHRHRLEQLMDVTFRSHEQLVAEPLPA